MELSSNPDSSTLKPWARCNPITFCLLQANAKLVTYKAG